MKKEKQPKITNTAVRRAPTLAEEHLRYIIKQKSTDLHEARNTINKQRQEIERLRLTVTDLNNKLEKAKETIWEQSKRLGPTDTLEAENQRLSKRVSALESEVASLKRTGNPGQIQYYSALYLEKKEEVIRLQARLKEYEKEFGVKA